jgi:hypothetical protein
MRAMLDARKRVDCIVIGTATGESGGRVESW